MLADPDHVDTGRGHLADDGTDLGRSYIEPGDDVLRPTHLQRRSTPAEAGVARVAAIPGRAAPARDGRRPARAGGARRDCGA